MEDNLTDLVKQINREFERLLDMPPCEYCGLTFVHRHNCLEIMNKQRTPTGDWWKI